MTGRKGRRLDGFRQPIVPDARGWLWSEQLGLFVGLWQGWVGDQEAGWVRLYRPDGTLVPPPQEQAEAGKQRAEEERQRAEAELARLRVLIQEQGRDITNYGAWRLGRRMSQRGTARRTLAVQRRRSAPTVGIVC